MKIFWTLLILVLLSSKYGYSQADEKIAIPVLKETQKIDEFMQTILKKEIMERQAEKQFLRDSCWLFEMIKIDDSHISLQLARSSKKGINLTVNKRARYKAKYGYFEYNGNNIFVWTTGDFGTLFTETGLTTTFAFIYPVKFSTGENEPKGSFLHYQYHNGRFLPEGPPSVEN